MDLCLDWSPRKTRRAFACRNELSESTLILQTRRDPTTLDPLGTDERETRVHTPRCSNLLISLRHAGFQCNSQWSDSSASRKFFTSYRWAVAVELSDPKHGVG
jgi:hypothetical protein